MVDQVLIGNSSNRNLFEMLLFCNPQFFLMYTLHAGKVEERENSPAVECLLQGVWMRTKNKKEN